MNESSDEDTDSDSSSSMMGSHINDDIESTDDPMDEDAKSASGDHTSNRDNITTNDNTTDEMDIIEDPRSSNQESPHRTSQTSTQRTSRATASTMVPYNPPKRPLTITLRILLTQLSTASQPQLNTLFQRAKDLVKSDANFPHILRYQNCTSRGADYGCLAMLWRCRIEPAKVARLAAVAVTRVCPPGLIVPLLVQLGFVRVQSIGDPSADFLGEPWLVSVMRSVREGTSDGAMLPSIMSATPGAVALAFVFEVLQMAEMEERALGIYEGDFGPNRRLRGGVVGV